MLFPLLQKNKNQRAKGKKQNMDLILPQTNKTNIVEKINILISFWNKLGQIENTT